MIKVVIKSVNDALVSIVIKGHAYSGEPGRDLVCAGVSAVTIGALNALEDVDTAFKTNVRDGLVEITPLYRPSSRNTVVLDVLITSLKTIETSYGMYIKIDEERKKLQ